MIAVCAPLLPACGATTLRVDVAPTIDSGGQAGFESTFSVGIGLPLDYSGRSHHYLQTAGALGGGLEPRAAAGEFVSATSLNYIYWAEPSMDVEAGLRFAYRSVPSVDEAPSLFSLGGRLALLPIVLGSDGSWMLAHFCVGPELRLEQMWPSDGGDARALFSLPLVIALNLLAAGD